MRVERGLLSAYANVFIARWDCYPLQNADGSYRSVKQSLTLALVEAHIQGRITLDAYALDRDSKARWVCLDADSAAQWDALVNLARELEGEGVRSYLERSRRGGHLWLFTPHTASRELRRFGKQLLGRGAALEDVELYPKQDQLATGPGSLVRLPLGIHRKTGKRYAFTTVEGELLAPSIRAQMALLAAPEYVPEAFIQAVLQITREPERLPASPHPNREVSGKTVAERIKNAISVHDFVGQFVQLNRAGRGLCPFHDDHIESFSVNQEANYWHCFAGCGGGSIIDFWSRWRGLHGQSPDFTATVTELAKMLL